MAMGGWAVEKNQRGKNKHVQDSANTFMTIVLKLGNKPRQARGRAAPPTQRPGTACGAGTAAVFLRSQVSYFLPKEDDDLIISTLRCKQYGVYACTLTCLGHVRLEPFKGVL